MGKIYHARDLHINNLQFSVIGKCDSRTVNSALIFLVRGLHYHVQKTGVTSRT